MALRQHCDDCELRDRESGTYVSDDDPPGLVETSDDESESDDVPRDASASLNVRLNPYA